MGNYILYIAIQNIRRGAANTAESVHEKCVDRLIQLPVIESDGQKSTTERSKLALS